jgi:hypothetical protein
VSVRSDEQASGYTILSQNVRVLTESGQTSKYFFLKITNHEEVGICYINNKGPVIQIPVPKGKTVTGNFYKNIVINKLKKYFESHCPKCA